MTFFQIPDFDIGFDMNFGAVDGRSAIYRQSADCQVAVGADLAVPSFRLPATNKTTDHVVAVHLKCSRGHAGIVLLENLIRRQDLVEYSKVINGSIKTGPARRAVAQTPWACRIMNALSSGNGFTANLPAVQIQFLNTRSRIHRGGKVMPGSRSYRTRAGIDDPLTGSIIQRHIVVQQSA